MSLNDRMEALARSVLGHESAHAEGPCRRFLFGEEAELDAALGDFLERFLEEAVAP